MLSLREIEECNMLSIEKFYKKYYNAPFYKQLKLSGLNINFVKAEGMYLYDEDGRKYLDFLAGFGAENIGHNNKKLISALNESFNKPNLIQSFVNPYAAGLSYNLNSILNGKLNHFFYTSTGSETVEEALKLSLMYKKNGKIIYFNGAYHGKTLGTLSAMGAAYKYKYRPLLNNFIAASFGDIEGIINICRKNMVSAIIIEPIQGEGGINKAEDDFLRSLRKICDKYDILLIFDEIQTGLGRCGDFFYSNKINVYPDILCMSKSLGGGIMPIGCMAVEDSLYHVTYGTFSNATLLSSTFGGNTLSCIAAITTLNIIDEEQLCENAGNMGKYIKDELLELKGKYDIIKDVRGEGLMLGIEFNISYGSYLMIGEFIMASFIEKLLKKYGIIVSIAANNPSVIKVEPPLIVNKAEADYFIESLESVLKEEYSTPVLLKKSLELTMKNLI